jgi:hypothetical protein
VLTVLFNDAGKFYSYLVVVILIDEVDKIEEMRNKKREMTEVL